MRRFLMMPVAVLALAAVAKPAAALELQFKRMDGRGIVYANGPIIMGDSNRLRALVAETRRQHGADAVHEVRLTSPGGLSLEGFAIGRAVRELRLDTHIEEYATCASACAAAFLGGINRTMGAGARYGVHMHTRFPGDGTAADRIVGRLQEVPKPQRLEELRRIEEGSARVAGAYAIYLQDMGVDLRLLPRTFDTPSATLAILQPEELVRLRVVTRPVPVAAAPRELAPVPGAAAGARPEHSPRG